VRKKFIIFYPFFLSNNILTFLFPFSSFSNHESAQNYTHYKARFQSIADNAGKNSGSGTAMFYSLNEGLAHFVFWDSEAYWSQPVDSQVAMINWLTADLAAANKNRDTVPWVIGLAHKGWWMEDTIAPPSGAGAIVWQILNEGGVDFHIVGHIHYVSLSLPFFPIYIILLSNTILRIFS
jgi:hypothetical protein